jgi:hypothetical protein
MVIRTYRLSTLYYFAFHRILVKMKSFEESTHAFIVRIWLEPREIEDAAPEWRGVIQHTSSGERRSFNGLHEIEEFISPYLIRKFHD